MKIKYAVTSRLIVDGNIKNESATAIFDSLEEAWTYVGDHSYWYMNDHRYNDPYDDSTEFDWILRISMDGVRLIEDTNNFIWVRLEPVFAID